MEENLQLDFFKKIKLAVPHLSLADEIADLLNISTDSAYRRLRGETDLSLNECQKIARHFKVPVGMTEHSDQVPFSYQFIDTAEITLIKYLTAIYEDITKIEKYEKKHITYAAKDIPLFHHFRFPELASFKIFFWLKSILCCPVFEKANFDQSMITDEERVLGNNILTVYDQVPSAEIWTEETLNSTLKQIEYYWESGFFNSKETGLLLCSQLSEMMETIKTKAEKGHKLSETNGNDSFKLYLSEVMIGNNNILVKTNDVLTTYLTHNTLNYLITQHSSFCAETEVWMKNLVKKSVLLSEVSEKARNRFFRQTEDSIKALVKKIEG